MRADAPKASIIGALALVMALIVGMLTPVAAASAAPPAQAAVAESGIVPAADLSQFQPGNIVSDAVFFYKDSMNEAHIQAFLESKVPSCQSGYSCLKDWYDTSRTTTADAMCGAYAGGVRERASRIIYKVAQACGINPQVILVTLQKEQGLVTHVWPSDWRYTIAMGQGCPDTAACDTRYYGFFNQVYGAAWQLKRYANPPGTSQYFTWYAPGKTWNVRWHPNAACGSSPVYIQNQATSNLYYYTPYQPNAAALRAGYGTGDGCSSYGNRNFFNYFTDWFGSTQVPANACSQPGSVAAADGEFIVNVASLNARSAPSTSCEPVARSLSQGTTVTRTGTFGDWARIRIDGVTYWVFASYLSPAPAVAYTADRIAGDTRYATAAEIALRTHPATAATVFLASGENFPDALSGSAAAARQGAPLLLTTSQALPPETAAALQRLAPSRVVILGGEVSVSTAVADAVKAIIAPGGTVDRIGGADRFETSRDVVKAGWTTAPTVYIATGMGFADALSASGVAAAQGAPVILVDGRVSSLDAATIDTLAQLGTTSVVLAGGTVVIPEGIATQLTGLGIAVDRRGGADRYETSRLFAAAAYPSNAPRVYVASGENFPDALSGSILAGQQRAPIFVTPGACLSGPVKDYMIARQTTTMSLVGGPQALSDDVLRSARC